MEFMSVVIRETWGAVEAETKSSETSICPGLAKLISSHAQNQERQAEALGYPSQTWVAFTDFHHDLGHAIWD